jgi:hypothetical protein
LPGFNLCLVLLDLVVDLAADDELGGVDGFFGIGAAGVAVAVGVEGEVVGLMLVLFVCGSEGLEILGFTSKEDCRRRETAAGLAVLIGTESQCCRRTGALIFP